MQMKLLCSTILLTMKAQEKSRHCPFLGNYRYPQPLAVAWGRKAVTEAAIRLGHFGGNTGCASGKEKTQKTMDTGV